MRSARCSSIAGGDGSVAFRGLARLAEQRGDEQAADEAYKQAALL